MCGADTFTESLFSMRKLDDFVPEVASIAFDSRDGKRSAGEDGSTVRRNV